MESLVIVNYHVTVNDISNSVHTAHHARRVLSFGNLPNSEVICLVHKQLKIVYLKIFFFFQSIFSIKSKNLVKKKNEKKKKRISGLLNFIL